MSTTLQPESTATYYGDFSAVSHSALRVFARSRRKYKAIYIDRTLEPPKPSDAMIRGTLLHLLRLEPERWSEVFVETPATAPDGKKWYRRKGSDHERWWAEFEASLDGRITADSATAEQVRGMADALFTDTCIFLLLECDGPFEHVLRWTDKATGLACKCKLDKWAVDWSTIADLKSTADCSPASFARTIETRGYWTQGAFYIDGLKQATGEVAGFGLCAVEADKPHDTSLYELDDDWLAAGRARNQKLLRDLAECLEKNDWRNPWEKGKTLSRPGWAERNETQWET